MINQKTICAKIDHKVLEQLDMEAYAQGRPRNRVLNIALVAYIDLQDSIRRAKAVGDPVAEEGTVTAFWERWAKRLH